MRTILIVLFLVLYVIFSLVALPVLALVGKFSPKRKQFMSEACIKCGLKIILFLAGIKKTVIGLENVPKDKAVVFAINHRGFFDLILSLSLITVPCGAVAKKSLNIPIFGTWAKNKKCVFIDRENPREGIKAIMEGIENIKAGTSMMIAPEGTRNHGEGLLPFKPGSLKMAEKTGCPIIPIAVNGSDDVWENHFPWVKAHHMCIEFGEPIYPHDMNKEEKKELLDTVRNKVLSMYEKNKQYEDKKK